MPGVQLAGLIDPARVPLDAALLDCFDAIHTNAYAAGAPWCFVWLQPGVVDPLFAARLLQTVPSVAVELSLPAATLAREVAAYWVRRSSEVVDRSMLWATVKQLIRPPDAGRGLAVFTTAPYGALARGLRGEQGAAIFGAELVAMLSPRFGRTLFIIEGRPDEGGLLALLRRFGGDVVLTGTCLLRAYGDARATTLAEAELGRAVPAGELAQWRAGIARPAALLLGDVASAARTLWAPSRWLAAEVSARFGRTASVVPLAIGDAIQRGSGRGVISAAAAGLQAEACVWALELLRFWGVPVRMALDCPAEEQAAMAGLATRLGVAGKLSFGAETGAVTAELAMRGDGRSAAGLATGLALGRWSVGSKCLSEGLDAPPWLTVVPDQASPPLLAAALRSALEAELPSGPAAAAWASRHRLVAALL